MNIYIKLLENFTSYLNMFNNIFQKQQTHMISKFTKNQEGKVTYEALFNNS